MPSEEWHEAANDAIEAVARKRKPASSPGENDEAGASACNGKRKSEGKQMATETQVQLEPTTVLLERLVDELALTDRGAAYLKTRGIERSTAEQVGIVDTVRPKWGAWCAKVEDDDILRASGLVVDRSDGPDLHPYYNHFLIFPYWNADDDGWTFNPEVGGAWTETASLETVRFRSSEPSDKPKMMSLTSDGPTNPEVPYLEGSVGVAGRYRWPLFVVEGELDALSIVQSGWPAVATNSASTWRDEWCAEWVAERIPQVVVIAEGDEAGRRFPEVVAGAAKRVCGTAWAETHLSSVHVEAGRDVNDLLMAGELYDRLEYLIDQLLDRGDLR